jgi:hypothetical protein
VASLAITFACIAYLMRTIHVTEPLEGVYRTGGIITIISGGVIFFLGFTGLKTIPLLISVILLMLLPVFYGIKVWVGRFGAQDLSELEPES